MDLLSLGLSSSETGIQRASRRKWSSGRHRHQPLLWSLCSGGLILVPRLGDTLGGALLTGSTQSVGRRAPYARVCAKAPALLRRFLWAAGRPESHMMSQTMTQAWCLNLTLRTSCTMSHPGHPARCIRGANTWPNASPPFASASRRRGSWPDLAEQGAGGQAPRAAWRVVMSRAAVGGSLGGEAPPGEFSESSAALH